MADCQHAFRFMCFVPARFHRAVGFPFEPPQLDECSICAKKLIFMMTSTVLRPVFVRPDGVWRQKSVRSEIIHIHDNFSCPRPCLLRIHSSPDHQADRNTIFSPALLSRIAFLRVFLTLIVRRLVLSFILTSEALSPGINSL